MQIAPEIIAVLSQAIVSSASVTLQGQLDAKTYKKVAAVLEECGAKWNRKAKCHLFATTNAQERIETVLATGEVTTAKDVGFFPTPAKLARELVAHAGIKAGDRVLEPSAGTGNLVKAILEHEKDVTVVAIEIDPERPILTKITDSLSSLRRIEIIIADFMDYQVKLSQRFDAVVMNPPFTKVGKGNHIDHVKHAFSMLKPGGKLAAILPSSIEFREDRRHKEFRAWIAGCEGGIERLPEGSFKESGTNVNTCMIAVTR